MWLGNYHSSRSWTTSRFLSKRNKRHSRILPPVNMNNRNNNSSRQWLSYLHNQITLLLRRPSTAWLEVMTLHLRPALYNLMHVIIQTAQIPTSWTRCDPLITYRNKDWALALITRSIGVRPSMKLLPPPLLHSKIYNSSNRLKSPMRSQPKIR